MTFLFRIRQHSFRQPQQEQLSQTMDQAQVIFSGLPKMEQSLILEHQEEIVFLVTTNHLKTQLFFQVLLIKLREAF